MIDKKEILWLATLARLELTEDEVLEYAKDLSSILNFVDQLKELDTSGVEPTHHATGLKNVLRVDEITRDHDFKKELLEEAPLTQDGAVQVRAVLEEYKQ